MLDRMKDRVNTYRTQTMVVYDHLKLGKSISGIEALHLYKVRDLPKRISELRAQGAEIHGKFFTDTTGSRYMRYWLTKQA